MSCMIWVLSIVPDDGRERRECRSAQTSNNFADRDLEVSINGDTVPKNGWFIMDSPIEMDDLGVSLFQETTTWVKISLLGRWFKVHCLEPIHL